MKTWRVFFQSFAGIAIYRFYLGCWGPNLSQALMGGEKNWHLQSRYLDIEKLIIYYLCITHQPSRSPHLLPPQTQNDFVHLQINSSNCSSKYCCGVNWHVHTMYILWSSGKGQARIGKGWPLRWKASKLKPLPRAYTKVGCHHPPPPPPPTRKSHYTWLMA